MYEIYILFPNLSYSFHYFSSRNYTISIHFVLYSSDIITFTIYQIDLEMKWVIEVSQSQSQSVSIYLIAVKSPLDGYLL